MSSLHHQAGMYTALAELGMCSPATLEKQAFLAPMLRGGAKLLGGALGLAGKGGVGLAQGTGKGMWGAGKSLYGVGGKAVKGVWGTAKKPLEMVGQGVLGAAQRGHLGSTLAKHHKTLGALGKGLPGQMLGFGLLEGSIGAATAAPGSRMNAFGKGMSSGMLSGALYGAGSNALGMGARKLIGANRMTRLTRAAATPAQGRMRQWGAKAGLGALSVGGMVGGDIALAPLGQSMLYDGMRGNTPTPHPVRVVNNGMNNMRQMRPYSALQQQPRYYR